MEVAPLVSVFGNPQVVQGIRDYSRLPAKLNFHPYFHTPASSEDCYLVGHKCGCPRCHEVQPMPSLAKKQKKEQADTAVITIEASPAAPPQPFAASAADVQTVNSFVPDLRVPGSPRP